MNLHAGSFTSDRISTATSITKAYSFNEHIHRYAVWTAARAVQRSFTTTDKIADAIEATSLRSFAANEQFLSWDEYDLQQSQWCHQLIDLLAPHATCSYGRAAKIVAIYLKTSIILPSQGNTPICEVIHPPIDSILLMNLVKELKFLELRGERWTRFTINDYWNVVDLIRRSVGIFNWKLEAFWQPQQKTETTTIDG